MSKSYKVAKCEVKIKKAQERQQELNSAQTPCHYIQVQNVLFRIYASDVPTYIVT